MKKYKFLIFPSFSTIFLYLAFNLTYFRGFDSLFLSVFSLDFAIQLAVGFMLFAFSRKDILVPLMQAIIMALFYLSTPVKMTFFSSLPFGPYDIPAVISLFNVLPLSAEIALCIVGLSTCALFVCGVDINRRNIFAILAIVILMPASLYAYATEINVWLDKRYSYQIWNMEYNYLSEGGTVYFLHETVKIISEKRVHPDKAAVNTSLCNLGNTPPSPVSSAGRKASYNAHGEYRNVHLFVVESFIDPVNIFELTEENDPFYGGFRRLYQEGGSSTSLSPVYTGGTANAEFEILCGFPIFDGKIAFEHELENESIPCLPGILSAAGFYAVASHPNAKNFWNRFYVYPKIGFTAYHYEDDFTFDDLNGMFLSDESLYRQNLELVDAIEKPLFNYVLTISNHYPYQLNENRNKKKFIEEPLINNYLNTVYHGTRELYFHIQKLLRLDPDALILVVGDHSPYFGPNLRGYVDVGVFKDKGLLANENDLIKLTSTPLLLIDGRNGPKSVGTISHYEIPGIILDALGLSGFTPQESVLHSDGMHMRPIPGYPFLSWNKDMMSVCTDKTMTSECNSARSWQRNVEVLREDILFGEQYQLMTTTDTRNE